MSCTPSNMYTRLYVNICMCVCVKIVNLSVNTGTVYEIVRKITLKILKHTILLLRLPPNILNNYLKDGIFTRELSLT